MTAWPDGTALWVRGTNEVVDGREGYPPSVSPVNTSCEGPRGQTVSSNCCYTFSKACQRFWLKQSWYWTFHRWARCLSPPWPSHCSHSFIFGMFCKNLCKLLPLSNVISLVGHLVSSKAKLSEQNSQVLLRKKTLQTAKRANIYVLVNFYVHQKQKRWRQIFPVGRYKWPKYDALGRSVGPL